MIAADDSKLVEAIIKANKAISLLERTKERNPGDDESYYEQKRWFARFRRRYADAVEGLREVEELGGECPDARSLLLTYEGAIIAIRQFLAQRAALIKKDEGGCNEKETIVSATDEPRTENGSDLGRDITADHEKKSPDSPLIISATPSFEKGLQDSPLPRPKFRLIPEVVVPTLASIQESRRKRIKSPTCERCEKSGTKCIGHPGRACRPCVQRKSRCSNVIKPGSGPVRIASGSGSGSQSNFIAKRKSQEKAKSRGSEHEPGLEFGLEPRSKFQAESRSEPQYEPQYEITPDERASSTKIYTSKKRRNPVEDEEDRHLTPLQKRVRAVQEEVEVEAFLMSDPIDDREVTSVALGRSSSPNEDDGKQQDMGINERVEEEEEDASLSSEETISSKTSTKVSEKHVIAEMQQRFVSLEAQFKSFSDMVLSVLVKKPN